MLKAVLAGTAALVIVGSTFVYAQSRPGRPDGASRWQPSVEDMRAFGEARLAALKAGLMLTAEQERLWPAFENAARTAARLRIDRMQAFAQARREEPRTTDPIERLRLRGESMAQTGIALQRLAEAADPLYKSLDDSQKRRFAMLSRMGGPGMMGPRGGRGGDFGGRDGFRGRDGGFDGPRGFDRGPRRMEFAPDGDFRRGPRDGFRPRSDGFDGAPRPGLPGEEHL